MSSSKIAMIPIHEIFGPTIQGEGMVIGQKTMFIRTGGCDYKCAWCDSSFTWDGSEKPTMMTPEEIWQKLVDLAWIPTPILEDPEAGDVGKLNFNHVTISGGNPALIKGPMEELIALLHANDIKVGIETQGSRWQGWFWAVDDLTISPKPPSSEMIIDLTVLDDIIEKLDFGARDNFSLKVVVFNDEDYVFAQIIHRRYPNVPFYLSVGNVDSAEQGDISQRLLRKLGWLWDKVLKDPTMNDAKPLPQLHTLVWANRRKV
jgi:7-carboxy-7-deazaguanine synthase